MKLSRMRLIKTGCWNRGKMAELFFCVLTQSGPFRDSRQCPANGCSISESSHSQATSDQQSHTLHHIIRNWINYSHRFVMPACRMVFTILYLHARAHFSKSCNPIINCKLMLVVKEARSVRYSKPPKMAMSQ